MPSLKPLVFVDLDDTLFQTGRKMAQDGPRQVAALDIHGQPNSYMSPVQHSLVRWLLTGAEVVPVTARSVEAYSRVQLKFSHGAICGHGGVMLGPDKGLDLAWRAHMASTLAPFQERLPVLSETTLALGAAMGFSLRGWVVTECGLHLYVVTKANDNNTDALASILAAVQSQALLDNMYVHLNGNNLAFLPNSLAKRLAVQEWLQRDRRLHGERLTLGFGDSLTDLDFMNECHLWATPSRGQVAQALGSASNA